MRKKINGVWHDLSTASLIAETQSMTAFSGRISIGLYRSQNGQWLQCIRPTHGNDSQAISHWISPNTAKTWLKKHSFSLQLQEYFDISECRLWPERQILVAEKKSPNSTSSHDLIRVEKLYYHRYWRHPILPLNSRHRPLNIECQLRYGFFVSKLMSLLEQQNTEHGEEFLCRTSCFS